MQRHVDVEGADHAEKMGQQGFLNARDGSRLANMQSVGSIDEACTTVRKNIGFELQSRKGKAS